MEFIVVLAVAAAAAAYILLPRPGAADIPEEDRVEALRQERARLIDLLRELDEDAAAGRISPTDRLDGRRALGPRLREVTEALQRLGEFGEPVSRRRSGAATATNDVARDEERAPAAESADPRP